jgi:hypothetical protein
MLNTQGCYRFSGKKQGWGGGRSTSRINTWKCKDGEAQGENQAVLEQEKSVDAERERNQVNSNWEGSRFKDEIHPQWGPTGTSAIAGGEDKLESGNTQHRCIADGNPNSTSNQKIPCQKCGLYNHATKDCYRLFCEICEFNHRTLNYKRCVPWNVGPELCAAQVEDQSFFFIEECIDTSVAKEKVSTTVISVIRGIVTAKQIEQEFMNLIGADG